MRNTLPALLFMALLLQSNNSVLAQDESLGRLFYTPRQRASLDANVRTVTRNEPPPAPIPPSVTVNGVVTRSDGERTVWIDGQPYHRDETGDVEVTVEPEDPGVVELKVQGVPNKHPVRVGQRLDPASGQTLEAFESPQRNAGNSGAEPASTPPSRK